MWPHRKGGDQGPYQEDDDNRPEGQRGGGLVGPRHAVVEAEREEERQGEQRPRHQHVLDLQEAARKEEHPYKRRK